MLQSPSSLHVSTSDENNFYISLYFVLSETLLRQVWLSHHAKLGTSTGTSSGMGITLTSPITSAVTRLPAGSTPGTCRQRHDTRSATLCAHMQAVHTKKKGSAPRAAPGAHLRIAC